MITGPRAECSYCGVILAYKAGAGRSRATLYQIVLAFGFETEPQGAPSRCAQVNKDKLGQRQGHNQAKSLEEIFQALALVY